MTTAKFNKMVEVIKPLQNLFLPTIISHFTDKSLLEYMAGEKSDVGFSSSTAFEGEGW